ncbi:hypothetical protein NM688_g8546 [Phlebia brevispora]|uniref:Uncharacterized protein n=1 Tax=Phlebia brevispora TaxID=194682 RepID=A0ACC1RS23_9APHY|nr:hypothetical protein NM688_g8546 [Phlebia brevispora]
MSSQKAGGFADSKKDGPDTYYPTVSSDGELDRPPTKEVKGSSKERRREYQVADDTDSDSDSDSDFGFPDLLRVAVVTKQCEEPVVMWQPLPKLPLIGADIQIAKLLSDRPLEYLDNEYKWVTWNVRERVPLPTSCLILREKGCEEPQDPRWLIGELEVKWGLKGIFKREFVLNFTFGSTRDPLVAFYLLDGTNVILPHVRLEPRIDGAMDMELVADVLSAPSSAATNAGSIQEDSDTARIDSTASSLEPAPYYPKRIIPGGEIATSLGLNPTWFPEQEANFYVNKNSQSLLEWDDRWTVLVWILDPVKVRTRAGHLIEPPHKGPITICDLGTIKLLRDRCFECWCPSREAWLEVRENTVYNAQPPVLLLRELGVIDIPCHYLGCMLGRVEGI